jgi:RNA polymerase sigma-70 factor, ECF subfamily
MIITNRWALTMDTAGPSPVTQLLRRGVAGERGCLDELVPLVEHELRRMAHRHMRNERQGHTLQTTALVNEAYLKLVDQKQMNWQHRAQFFGVAAGLMRRILVDHARGLHRAKRGGAGGHLPIDEGLVFAPGKSSALIALDDALDELAKKHSRQARVVELRYFGGLSVEEAAEALETHPNTVIRDWSFAKAWLARELRHKQGQQGQAGSP